MSQTAIRTGLVTAVGAIVLLTMGPYVEAQSPTNAALQARARMQQRHSQTGAIGGGYRPYSVWTYQKSANTHAQALNAYGQNCKQLPPATAKEHLTEIQRSVAATKKEIAKLGPEAAQAADVKENVMALEKHLIECEKLCGMMEKTIGDDGVDVTQMCAHCASLESKLKAADAEHRELLKKIGIELPTAAVDHAEHHPEKRDSGGIKKE